MLSKRHLATALLALGLSGCHLLFPFETSSPGPTEAGVEADRGIDAISRHDAHHGEDATKLPPHLFRNVSADGWGLRRPIFRDNGVYHGVRGIWGVSAGELWIAGEGGWIARRTSNGWRPVATPTTSDLQDVWGAAADQVWFVGSAGTLLGFDGAALTQHSAGTQKDLHTIHGSASAGLWIGGDEGIVLGRPPQGAWGPYHTGKTVSAKAIFAGAGGEVWVAYHGELLRRSTGPWDAEPVPGSDKLWSLWGHGARPTLAGDLMGKVFNYTSSGWTTNPSFPASQVNVRDLWVDDAQDVWAAVDHAVYRRRGATWEQSLYDTERSPHAFWGAGGDLYAAFTGGNIFRYDGALERWYRTMLSHYQYFTSASGNQAEVWLVGGSSDNGVAFRNAGGGFEQVPQKVGSPALRGVWTSPQGVTWAVGERGTVVRYNPASGLLEPVVTGETTNLRGVWGYGNEIWACGDKGMILHFDGKQWNVAQFTMPSELYAIWGSSALDIWAVGAGGSILRREGTSWKQLTHVLTTESLRHLHGRSSKEIWAVGHKGVVLRYANGGWSKQPSPVTDNLWSVWVSPGGDVWITGAAGKIYRRTAGAWKPQALPASALNSAPLSALWGRADDDIWVAGTKGTVLHFDDRL